MKLSPAGLLTLEDLERLRLKAYPDDGGVWTIGYGHIGLDVHYGMVITPEIAAQLLAHDVEASEAAVNRAVKVPIKQNQFDALVILVFNIGVAGFFSSSILRDINSGDLPAEQPDWMKWNKIRIKGRLTDSAGLMHRRQKEWAIFSA